MSDRSDVPISNVDQLRKSIDRGAHGDKVNYPDPAAAPLGTDDEAGGVSPTAEQVRGEAPRATRVDDASAARRGRVIIVGFLIGVAIAVGVGMIV